MTVEETKETKESAIEEKTSAEIAAETKEVSKLSDEDIKWRAKYKMSKSEYEDFKNSSEKEKNQLLEKYNAESSRRAHMETQVIEAKLEAQAIAAGLKDIELVKLIDKTNIKLNDKGEVEGLQEAVNAFKTRKPEYFGAEKKTSTSSNAGVGTATETKTTQRNAWDVPKDEWKRNKQRYMSGNFS